MILSVEFEYFAREIDELNLKVGDIIVVINSEEDEGWFRGVVNARFGLFPENVSSDIDTFTK